MTTTTAREQLLNGARARDVSLHREPVTITGLLRPNRKENTDEINNERPPALPGGHHARTE